MVALEAEVHRAFYTFRAFSTWFQPVKRPAEELTCAGIVIDPDVARMADAHEGAGGVNAHGVLPAVVLPFSALINIWRERSKREGERGKNKAGLDVDCCHIVFCQVTSKLSANQSVKAHFKNYFLVIFEIHLIKWSIHSHSSHRYR